MVNTLSGSVCAYRKETVKPRLQVMGCRRKGTYIICF